MCGREVCASAKIPALNVLVNVIFWILFFFFFNDRNGNTSSLFMSILVHTSLYLFLLFLYLFLQDITSVQSEYES